MEYIQVSIIDPWNIFYISADNELQKSKVTTYVNSDGHNSKYDFCKHRNKY